MTAADPLSLLLTDHAGLVTAQNLDVPAMDAWVVRLEAHWNTAHADVDVAILELTLPRPMCPFVHRFRYVPGARYGPDHAADWRWQLRVGWFEETSPARGFASSPWHDLPSGLALPSADPRGIRELCFPVLGELALAVDRRLLTLHLG